MSALTRPIIIIPCVLTAALVVLGVIISTTCVYDEPKKGIQNRLLVDSDPQYSPDWTPDGTVLIFTHAREGIFSVDSDGTSLERLSVGTEVYQSHHSPDISPDGSTVVYTTTRHVTEGDFGSAGLGRRRTKIRNFEIESVTLEGSNRRRLTVNPVLDTTPQWSSRGDWVALTRYDSGGLGIYVMAPDGSDVRQIVRPIYEDPEKGSQFYDATLSAGPVWSPQSTMLAYVIEEREHSTVRDRRDPRGYPIRRDVLYVSKTDEPRRVELFRTVNRMKDVILGSIAWEPNGQRVAFLVLEAPKTVTLYTVDVVGARYRSHATWDFGGPDPSLSWSPDGTEILASSALAFTNVLMFPRYEQKIYVVNVESSLLRVVAQGTHASWSPDGSKIAVLNRAYEPHPGPLLSTMNADASNHTVLVHTDSRGRVKASRGDTTCLLWFC